MVFWVNSDHNPLLQQQACLNRCPLAVAVPAVWMRAQQMRFHNHTCDARKCISYLTIELKSDIPEQLRPQMGNWVYGCDVCQEVCPFNRFEEETVEHAFKSNHLDYAAPKLETILTTSAEEFKQTYEGSPIKRIKHERWLRNGAVAAGNSGRPDNQTAYPLTIQTRWSNLTRNGPLTNLQQPTN